MSLHDILQRHFPLVAIVAISGGVFSCTKQDTQAVATKTEIKLGTTNATLDKGQAFVYVTAPGDWTMSVYGNGDWAALKDTEGTGNAVNILSYDRNTGENERSCVLTLICGTDTTSALFVQSGYSTTIKSDPVPKWMELPATDNDRLYFFSHPMTIGGKKYRNYSYYWDINALVAHWVAYPLNKTLLSGSCGRSDAWGLDPKLPEKYQPVLIGTISGYQRGHQIPSADRQILEYNKETYYGTNMTPQNGGLNTGVWSSLEMYVRDCSRSFDTLYVVTGCVVKSGSRTVKDNRGKSISVPDGYFKALLGYSKNRTVGITNSTSGYTGIAFYFNNTSYSGSYMNQSMTIDELERKTGFDFFVNLPSAIGASKAAKVESTLDGWWSN